MRFNAVPPEDMLLFLPNDAQKQPFAVSHAGFLPQLQFAL